MGERCKYFNSDKYTCNLEFQTNYKSTIVGPKLVEKATNCPFIELGRMKSDCTLNENPPPPMPRVGGPSHIV